MSAEDAGGTRQGEWGRGRPVSLTAAAAAASGPSGPRGGGPRSRPGFAFPSPPPGPPRSPPCPRPLAGEALPAAGYRWAPAAGGGRYPAVPVPFAGRRQLRRMRQASALPLFPRIPPPRGSGGLGWVLGGGFDCVREGKNVQP